MQVKWIMPTGRETTIEVDIKDMFERYTIEVKKELLKQNQKMDHPGDRLWLMEGFVFDLPPEVVAEQIISYVRN